MNAGERSLFWVIAAFGIMMAVLYVGMDALVRERMHPNADVASGDEASKRIELKPNSAGQYVVPGRINDRSARFLIDTGATHVSIPASVADRLDLRRGQQVEVQTAGGRIHSWRTQLDQLAIGGMRFTNVRATINPSLESDRVLLGTAVLRRLDIHQRDNRLILQAPPR